MDIAPKIANVRRDGLEMELPVREIRLGDVLIVRDDLSKLPFTVRLSRASLRVVKQNISFALLIKLAAVLLVFPGWLTLWWLFL